MNQKPLTNSTALSIVTNTVISTLSLFLYGLGVYLTIRANIGVSPWDVLNIGLSDSLHILYGTASISVSMLILIIDILLREPIGIAMFVDAIVVGKAVDFFQYLDLVPTPGSLLGSIALMLIGLTIMGYTQYFYMHAALGCGPRDTLLVGLKKLTRRIPIGIVSIALLTMATLIGYFLGGPVGIGTLICAFCSGPIMQFAFSTFHFDATAIRHQSITDSFRIMLHI